MNFLRATVLLIMDIQMESDTGGGNNTESCLVKCVINFALQVLIWQYTFFLPVHSHLSVMDFFIIQMLFLCLSFSFESTLMHL